MTSYFPQSNTDRIYFRHQIIPSYSDNRGDIKTLRKLYDLIWLSQCNFLIYCIWLGNGEIKVALRYSMWRCDYY